MRHHISALAAATVLFALLLASRIASGAPVTTPTTAAATPSASPAAAVTPASLVVAYGQLADLERGYAVFTTGDAFRVAPDAAIADAATNTSPLYTVGAGTYAVIALDPATGLVTAIHTSPHPLRTGIPVAQVPRTFAVATSPHQTNPELAPPPVVYHSQLSVDVLVTIEVEVPPQTPYEDPVFIATDSSGWNAQAIAMQRVDGRHFRIRIHLKPGTEFRYVFTRGSWQSVEREQSGLERKPRTLYVPGGDSMVVSATIYRWADIQ